MCYFVCVSVCATLDDSIAFIIETKKSCYCHYLYICIYNIFIYYFINRTVLLLLHRIPSTIPRELIKGNRGKVKLAKVLLDMGQGKREPQRFFSSNEALSQGRGKQRGTSRGKKGNDGHRVSIEDRGLAAWQHVGPDFFVQCVS